MVPLFVIWRNMLTDTARDSAFYREIDELMSAIGLRTVEASVSDMQGTRSIRVVVCKEGQEVDTDDLARAYNLIYPRYSVIYADRDIQLEVSSPGLQRNLKDVMEFSVFTGKDVRCYSVSDSCYIVGRIASCDGSSVTLSGYHKEDKDEDGESITLPFSDIAKAKLEYRWEA